MRNDPTVEVLKEMFRAVTVTFRNSDLDMFREDGVQETRKLKDYDLNYEFNEK